MRAGMRNPNKSPNPYKSPIGVLQISAYTLTLQAGGNRRIRQAVDSDRQCVKRELQRRSAGAQVNFGSKTKCGRSVDVSWTTTACDGLLISRDQSRLLATNRSAHCGWLRASEGSGCYGMNGHEDAAADAAILSRAVGHPVRVQWTRAGEAACTAVGAAGDYFQSRWRSRFIENISEFGFVLPNFF